MWVQCLYVGKFCVKALEDILSVLVVVWAVEGHMDLVMRDVLLAVGAPARLMPSSVIVGLYQEWDSIC